MILDINLLLLAIAEQSTLHERARDWLTQQFAGGRRIGLPWQTIVGFMRIATHPRALDAPLEPAEALGLVRDWLALDVVWIPAPGPTHLDTLSELVERHEVRGSLIPDARLAALAIEHGLTVCSADSDFARFPEVRWLNPLAS